MKKLSFLLASVIAVSLCLLCLGTAAHAQLRIDFDQPVLGGANGDTLTFSGLLTNLSAEDIRLDGDTFATSNDGLTLDDTPFVNAFLLPALTLAPGQSVGGDFFTVMIGPNPPVAPGVYDNSFTVLGQGLTSGQGVESTAGFQVVAAPEPGAGALLVSGLLLCGGMVLRNRRRPAALLSKEVL